MKIFQWNKLDKQGQLQALKRPVVSDHYKIHSSAIEILSEVKFNGDKALKSFSEKFDKVSLDSIIVTEDEYIYAENNTTPKDKNLLKKTIARIEHFHNAVKPKDKKVDTKDGVVCTKISRPIQNVGLYVPGGSAPLVSTLMMLAVPAKIAGCKNRVVCTPPGKNGRIHPLILVAAKMCGVTEVYKIGGAQAVGALAYGTKSVKKVDKIYGPGNAWVTAAKQIVSQEDVCVGIDMPAGPSEVLVIADRKANPVFVAADLLAQAEHGADSQAILVTDDDVMARRVILELERQAINLSRQKILSESISHIRAIVTKNLDQAVEVNNLYAPEHLIIQTENAEAIVDKVTAAGSIFVGAWAPEALGDYVTGSNHVLPTYGYAKNVSGLSTIDFMNTISVQEVSQVGIKNIGQMAMDLAEIEGLDAHRNAVKYRLDAIR